MNSSNWMTMKQLLLHNWKAKLICLALASVLWFVLRDTSNSGATGEESTWRLQPPPVWEDR